MLVSPKIETHYLDSKHVDQRFAVWVMQPVHDPELGEEFPVVYATDGNLSFGALAGLSQGLQFDGSIKPFILVGIGYPGEEPWTSILLRCRDFTAPEYPFKKTDLPILSMAGLEEPEGVSQWNGAKEFRKFIEFELVPFVERKYKALSGARTYFGHSAGAFFGFYIFLNSSGLFTNYILSSPVFADDDSLEVFDMTERILSSGIPSARNLLMSAGGQEEENSYRRFSIISNLQKMTKIITSHNYPNLNVSSFIFDNECHMSVWPTAFSRGVRELY